jgi:hypothetical protein
MRKVVDSAARTKTFQGNATSVQLSRFTIASIQVGAKGDVQPSTRDNAIHAELSPTATSPPVARFSRPTAPPARAGVGKR